MGLFYDLFSRATASRHQKMIVIVGGAAMPRIEGIETRKTHAAVVSLAAHL